MGVQASGMAGEDVPSAGERAGWPPPAFTHVLALKPTHL